MKVSPIARYLVENKVKAFKTSEKGVVEFRNAENKLFGRLIKGEAELGQYRFVSVDLFKPDDGKLFMTKRTEIEKTYRYFLNEHRFMPVRIEIENKLFDFEHNTLEKHKLIKGLKSDLYIEKLQESDELKQERKKLGECIPDDYPMYKINKSFKYEFKASMYKPKRKIDPNK